MVAMIPEFMSKPKMPLATSVPAALALFAFAIVYFSVGLWSAAFASLVSAGLWGILVADHPKFNKRKKTKHEYERRKDRNKSKVRHS